MSNFINFLSDTFIYQRSRFNSDKCHFQEVLESLWEKLQNDLSLRKEALTLASELFTFLRSVNQLIQWGTNMRKLFVSDELGR